MDQAHTRVKLKIQDGEVDVPLCPTMCRLAACHSLHVGGLDIVQHSKGVTRKCSQAFVEHVKAVAVELRANSRCWLGMHAVTTTIPKRVLAVDGQGRAYGDVQM